MKNILLGITLGALSVGTFVSSAKAFKSLEAPDKGVCCHAGDACKPLWGKDITPTKEGTHALVLMLIGQSERKTDEECERAERNALRFADDLGKDGFTENQIQLFIALEPEEAFEYNGNEVHL